jgi:hypothetical protein
VLEGGKLIVRARYRPDHFEEDAAVRAEADMPSPSPWTFLTGFHEFARRGTMPQREGAVELPPPLEGRPEPPPAVAYDRDTRATNFSFDALVHNPLVREHRIWTARTSLDATTGEPVRLELTRVFPAPGGRKIEVHLETTEAGLATVHFVERGKADSQEESPLNDVVDLVQRGMHLPSYPTEDSETVDGNAKVRVRTMHLRWSSDMDVHFTLQGMGMTLLHLGERFKDGG